MTRRRQAARRTLLALTLISLVAAVIPAATTLAADPVDVVFNATGAEQSWVVPAGVSSIQVVLVGGRGGDASTSGYGHVLTGNLVVSPGDTLYVEVGGNGANSIGLPGAAGGFNGGGAGGTGTENAGAGGGGASDIRTVSRTDAGTLASRLVVAAGGGGRGGGDTAPRIAGSGGSAGSNGGDPANAAPGYGGGAGTSSAGGSAGTGTGMAGTSGGLGVGGAGGDQVTGSFGNGGGGGGGGYYGGGGGAAGSGFAAGGGGGGSSYTGTATGAFLALDTSGSPSVTITYVVGPDATQNPATGTVDATISMTTSVCIELSTNSVDFGNGRFGEVGVAGTPEIAVTNCGPDNVKLYARGTNATAPGAAWNLVQNTSTCADTLGLNAYHLRLNVSQAIDPIWDLGTSNTELLTIAGGSLVPLDPSIDTACPGSSGANQQMSMQIIFTATEAQP